MCGFANRSRSNAPPNLSRIHIGPFPIPQRHLPLDQDMGDAPGIAAGNDLFKRQI
jgi:hypothetical protein